MKSSLLTRTVSRGASGVCLALACLAPLQAVRADVQTNSEPELVFVLWDTVSRAAYTLDLGIKANDFWLYAQQDGGYAFQYTLLASDARLTAFRAVSPTITNQRWAVLGVQSTPGVSTAGSNKVYSTLRQGPSDGTTNPNWQDLNNWNAASFLSTTQTASTRWFRDLNSWSGTDDRTLNTHANSANGSAVHQAPSPRYFANNGTVFARNNPGAEGSLLGGAYDITNAVNQSSWFYYVSNSADSGTAVVDEFDNLSYNGYWGLAYTSTNSYLLSFTLTAANVPRPTGATPEGTLRASTTDYAAFTGSARLLGLDDSELLAANPLPLATLATALAAPVPEPSSVALLGLGLAALLARARRRPH